MLSYLNKSLNIIKFSQLGHKKCTEKFPRIHRRGFFDLNIDFHDIDKEGTRRRLRLHRKKRLTRTRRLDVDEEDEFEGEVDSEERKKKRDIRKKKKATEIILPTYCTAKSLAAVLGTRAVDVVKILIKLNACPRSSEEYLDNSLVDLVVTEFGRIPVRSTTNDLDRFPRPPPEDPSIYPRRPPVVTVMGHIDHGKTTLLDTLRNAQTKEVGGITQRVSCFSTKVTKDHTITFIDTPGHAAFSRMRQRGANITDIAILVVAADEGVQEQTQQAIKFIQDAGCPFIVAINKCDKPNADPKKVRLQLNSLGIELAEFGGHVYDVEVSALKKQGIENLKETILLVAEENLITGDREGLAEANVLDVKKEDFRGVVVTCIVSVGTLKKGDAYVAGLGWGKIKNMYSMDGKPVQSALPGVPVEITGVEIECLPGDQLLVVENEEVAKQVCNMRIIEKEKKVNDYAYLLKQREAFKLKEIMQKDRIQAVQLGLDPDAFIIRQAKLRESLKAKEVPFILKADHSSSLEAVEDAISKLPRDEVYARIIRAEIGPITEDDVNQASILENKVRLMGFNIKVNPKTMKLAQQRNVTIKTFNIIYSLMDWVKQELSQYLTPAEESVIIAEARVEQIFKITFQNKDLNVAGSKIERGTFKRGIARVVRDGKVIYEGHLRSLRHEKQDVKSVGPGMECGISFGKDFDDFKVGDLIQNVEKRETPRKIGEEKKRDYNPFTLQAEIEREVEEATI